ncbi:ROK family protein [Spiroplasma turonicum]|uniref:Glucokinase n=1 Tax=Spiroplasma turonicum TaxID=216946 RepID=A0A0K1P5G7_9MOLU|nr:ROK family protein [Spiroplasma turonicum]AKU79546.1 glucokinase [Spiroplasma turonicum]ALX70569.1 glucokinase [Spiroplasma turonicum]
MKLAVDIGGTNIRLAIINGKEIIKRDSIISEPNDFEKNFSEILNVTNNWNYEIDSIGICCPGPFDPITGIIINSNNLPGWNNIPLRDRFQKAYKIKNIKLDNDANIAALGQYIVRNNLHSLLYFTISTGIGAGYVNNGKILNGFKGTALEIANAIPDIYAKNPTKSGIEFVASGRNIFENLKAKNIDISSTKDAFDLFKTKENQVVNSYFKHIEEKYIQFFSTAIYFFNPEIVVIGGSVALNNKEWFIDIFEKVNEITSDIGYKTRLEFALNLDDSTLIGCALM